MSFIALGGSPSSIAVGSDGAFWVTEFSPQAIARVTLGGKVTTFTTKTSPSVIVPGPDGNLWFLDLSGMIYKMTTSGKATLVKRHVQNSYIWSFNGGLWYIVPGYPALIKEMSTDGTTMKTYTEPDQCAPNALTGSPDGTLWYVDDFRSCVVRIGADGKAAVVPTHSQEEGQGYAGIAIGPSNDVWFTESGYSGLGWLDPKTF
jgi:virginiamycin B lyase